MILKDVRRHTWRVACAGCKSIGWKQRQESKDVSMHLTGRMTEGAGLQEQDFEMEGHGNRLWL